MDKAADHKEKARAWLKRLEVSVAAWQAHYEQHVDYSEPVGRWNARSVIEQFQFEPVDEITLYHITRTIDEIVNAMTMTPDAITQDDADALKELVRLRNNMQISLTIPRKKP